MAAKGGILTNLWHRLAAAGADERLRAYKVQAPARTLRGRVLTRCGRGTFGEVTHQLIRGQKLLKCPPH
eukprot:2527078-Amphidinium_carterae.2